MKRRTGISTRDPPIMRSSSVRGSNGVRSNRERRDTIRGKRVKFTDPVVAHPPHNEPAVSSLRHEATGAPGSDAPKTSEYAFFKKVKMDAGRCGSYLVHRELGQWKNVELSGSTRDTTTMFKDNYDNISSSILLEKARPSTHNFFSFPQANALNDSEETRVVENSHNKIRSTFLAKRIESSNASKQSGLEDLDEDIFSQKRKRLRLWVAETSIPEVEKLCSKGYDMVSVLLSRLFPDGDQSKYRRDSKTTQMGADTKYSSDKFLQDHTCDEKSHWTKARDFVETESVWYLDDFCNRSREIIPLKLNTIVSNSPSTSKFSSHEFLQEDTYSKIFHWAKGRDLIEVDSSWYLDDICNKTREVIPSILDTSVSNYRSTSQYSSDEFLQEDNYSQKFHWAKGRDLVEADSSWYLDDICNKTRQVIPFKLDARVSNNCSTSQFSSHEFLQEDTYSKQFHWTKSRHLIEADSSCYLGDICNKTSEVIPLKLGTRVFNSPSTSHAHFQSGTKKVHCNCEDGTAGFLTVCDPYFSSDLDIYGSNSMRHIKELNEFQGLDELADGRESSTLLLGWDFCNSQNEGDFNYTTHNREMNSLLTLVAPCDDHQQSLNNSSEVRERYSSLSISDHSSEITLFPLAHLENLSYLDSRRFVAKLKHCPLSFSYIPKYLNISDDCNNYTSYEVKNGVSPQHDDWAISRFSEKHHSDLEALLHSGLGLDTYWK